MAKYLGGDDNGVTQTGIWEEDNQLILTDTMPGDRIEKILQEKQHLEASKTANGSIVGATIPNYLWQSWRNEWTAGPEAWGVPWHKFLLSRLNSPEFSKLRHDNASKQRMKL